MDNKLKVFSGVLILTAGLSACGNNNAMDTRNNDNTRPVGYYTNDRDRNDRVDNDGPVTDMLENMDGRNGTTNVTDRNRRDVQVPTRGGTYSRGDMNYHNHLTDTTGTPNMRYDRPENLRISRNITGQINKMNQIDDCQVVVTDETAIIAVRADERLTNAERNQIRNTAKQYAGKRTVQVVKDNTLFTRFREMNDNPQNLRDRGDIRNGRLGNR
ncbi:YhcN/YlaJ family sporulation lipoprotein [Bacillus changyiensis]|uniref:YhcN/YlaJ family sporulation lipoprotein n=1 Tax=Bacillus changyiensis TaxID=3004103 RepID=UPI0022E2E8C0|nr:YhcN/YlaJ family sporulation lipoprotein [Bacillus changyiensis]MDA1477425.1 YhcN/YlaJ family sporulation lipoprotein [Bacillus changyiensis]